MKQVVRARLADAVAINTKCGTLDTVTTSIGKDVITGIARVSLSEVKVECAVVCLADHGDPHVDTIFTHGLGQYLVELLRPNLIHSFPPSTCLLRFGWGLWESQKDE